MEYVEEKTPGGITFKVMIKKWQFIAFEKNGKVIYADETDAKVLHKTPVIVFISENCNVVKNDDSELAFFKINKGKIVAPYVNSKDGVRKYLFIDCDRKMDLLPVRVKELRELSSLMRGKESNITPDYIAIDHSISEEDCVFIKNRFPNVTIIRIDESIKSRGTKKIGKNRDGYSSKKEDEGVDLANEKNLNIMSNNPVFLARIHLRDMALSKVNQLLLDFDISSLEADYMLKFIESMLKNSEERDNIEQNRHKLESLMDSFQFYIHLMERNEKEIQDMIEKIDDVHKIASYNTLIAKMRTLFTSKKDLLILTDYENLLYEKKDQFQSNN